MRLTIPIATALSIAVAIGYPNSGSATPGLTSSKAVKSMINELKNSSSASPFNIYEVEKQLKDHPTEATEALIDLLDTNDRALKEKVAMLLNRLSSSQDFTISDSSLKTVIGIAKATDYGEVQTNLISTLGNLGPKNDSVKETLIYFIEISKEVKTRRTAVEALSRLMRQEKPGPNGKTTDVLINVLQKDDSPAMRASAAGAFCNLGGDSKKIVPALIEALDDNYLAVRAAAVRALGQYRVEAKIAVPKMIEMLRTEHDSSIQSTLVYTLKNVDGDNVLIIAEYIKLLDVPNLRGTIVQYLSQYGDKAKDAVPKLIEIVETDNSYQKRYAVRALGEIGASARPALPVLTLALKDPDETTRRFAQEAISKIENGNN